MPAFDCQTILARGFTTPPQLPKTPKIMRDLIVIAVMAVVVAGYKKGRAYTGLLEDFPPYQGTHQSLHEQHHPFQEHSFKTQPYQPYRSRPYRQEFSSYPEQLFLKDSSLLKDYSSLKSRPFLEDSPSFRDFDPKGQSLKSGSFYDDSTQLKDSVDFRQPHSLRSRPYFDDSPSLKDSAEFKDQSSFFADGQLYKSRTNFASEQAAQDQTYLRDDFRFADIYDKQSPRDQSVQQLASSSFDRNSEYLKYGNHGLGYASVPAVSPYENALPLSEEGSTTMAPPMASTTTHQPLLQSTVSSTIDQVHMSATSEPKMASSKVPHAATMQTTKSDTLLVGGSSTLTDSTKSPVTAKQSSNLAQPSTGLTTESSSPVMTTESPDVFFERHKMPPIEFPGAKFTSLPQSYYNFNGGLRNNSPVSLLGYLLSQSGKTGIKLNEHASSLLNPPLPEGNNFGNKIQSSMLNYVLPEESKLKDNLQSSLLNYLLQQELNRGLSFQQSPVSGNTNYVQLASLAEKPKITLPGMSIATLSPVSRPLQTINYVSPTATLPRVSSFGAQVSPTGILPLGAASPPGLSPSVFNSLPGGMSDGIPAGIPAGISANVPTVPTLNFGQNLQHVGQLQQLAPATSQPFSTGGLQLQLGGFGGLDYTLRANPVQRSTDFGLAKMGLSLPELPRHQLPAVSKIGFEQHLW
ncbi:uncharacterized protein LOC108625509 isoform X2 [Ceratina calcarata]|uniref:Uncharacterized protein LOC108625509 isoform X2 n=1 Tax=Ceratina calcarata TaxID=156304 RepID=A0AAJ7S2M3_9HYME|nr:uncharacterized protein LOC108625509 isoform X2 [Ceratina calcarata]